MHGVITARICTIAVTSLLLSHLFSNPCLAQFEGLMVDGTTIRRFNVDTGAVLDTRPITGSEALFGMLAMDPDQQDLYMIDGFNDGSSDRTFRVNWQTGAGAVIGNTGLNWNFRWLDFNPVDGILYGGTDNRLYSINKTTGAATFLRDITSGSQLGQITAFGIRGNGQAYVADLDNFGNNDYQLYRLNLANGQASLIGTMFTGSSGASAKDLTFGPDGNLYATRRIGFSNNNELYRIDLTTGSATFLYNVGTGNLGLGVAFVPEPVAALPGGALAWASVRRRRSRPLRAEPNRGRS